MMSVHNDASPAVLEALEVLTMQSRVDGCSKSSVCSTRSPEKTETYLLVLGVEHAEAELHAQEVRQRGVDVLTYDTGKRIQENRQSARSSSS
jgi:hypothetical protein